MSNNQPNNHTTLATPGRGDVTFPFTPVSIDNMTIGQFTPADATVNNLTVNDATVMTGAVSGAGFVAAVEAIAGSGGTATNLLGGATGSLPYQTATSTTGMLPVGSNGQVLTLASGLPAWANTPGLAQNAQTSNYTTVLADAQKQIYFSGSTASQTITVPANSTVAYPIGTTITFINMASVSVSLTLTTDTWYWSPTGSTTATRTLAEYGIATAVKMSSTTWILSGQGLT